VITTKGTYQSSLVTQIFRSGYPGHGVDHLSIGNNLINKIH